MRLFHGSYCNITVIDLSFARGFKDFGPGFYLTPDFSRAVNMASRSVILNRGGTAEINPFIFNKTRAGRELKIKEFKTTNWEWAMFVMMNRDKNLNPPFHHDYDVVIGPVADSSVDADIEEYKRFYGNNYLEQDNLEVLAEKLKYPGNNYVQYCFCTEKSLKHLIKD